MGATISEHERWEEMGVWKPGPTAPVALDRPLMTMLGDLSERADKPDGWCWSCAAVWIFGVGVPVGLLIWSAVRHVG